MRVVVTEIGWDGSMRRRALHISGLTDAGRWGKPDRAGPGLPPPYRAAPGSPVYVIHAGGRAVLVGEQDLTGRAARPGDDDPGGGRPSIAATAGGFAEAGLRISGPAQDAGDG